MWAYQYCLNPELLTGAGTRNPEVPLHFLLPPARKRKENVPYSLCRKLRLAGCIPGQGRIWLHKNVIIPLGTFSLDLLAGAHTAFSYIFPLRLTKISIVLKFIEMVPLLEKLQEPRLFLLFAVPLHLAASLGQGVMTEPEASPSGSFWADEKSSGLLERK